ncbi:MAG TPA: family 16 glycosylhydrolase, partial [Noviherbaspirillum sp.]
MQNLNIRRSSIQAACCASIAILLAACGGGGGGAADPAAQGDLSLAGATTLQSSTGDVAASPAATPAAAPQAAAPQSEVGPYGQDASKYTMSFADEFDNGFDTKVWNSKIWYSDDNPTKNYAVEDGKLKIWPQRDASGKFFNRTIDTDGKFYQTYGYFEMEAKLPYGKGAWPAFWLLNHDRAHPDRPE